MLQGLSAALRDRKVSSVELVEESIRRIEATNSTLNAVVTTDYDRALETARATDQALDRGEDVGPLAGIPVLVKDAEDVAGLPTTFGSLTRAQVEPATEDGIVPARLRAAGAVVVGKTNAPEFSFEVYTWNPLFGGTVNPWVPEMSPGGSSGGSGAALAAGYVPVATGTDGGGSIRIPSSMCGLPGLKPTNGLVPRRPVPHWIDLSTDGAMATSLDDIELLLGITAGPVAGDPGAAPPGAQGTVDLARPRVLAAPRTYDWGPLPADVQAAFDEALRGLEQDLGLEVTAVDPADLFQTGNPDTDWFVLVCTEQANLLGRDFLEANEDRLDPVFLGHMRFGLDQSVADYLTARRRRFAYTRELDELLGTDGVLVTPTMAVAGFTPDGRPEPGTDRGLGPEVINAAVQNITGSPALTLPAGVLPNGVPFGLQVTGPRYSDVALLELGRRWQAARPWRTTAPGYAEFSVAGLGLV